MAVDLTGRNGWCYAKQSNKKSDYRICASAIVIIILCGSQLVFQKACIRKNRPWPNLGAADKKQFELLTDAYKIKNIPSEQITISTSDGIKLTGNYYEREKNDPLIIYFHGLWSNSYIDGVPIYRIT